MSSALSSRSVRERTSALETHKQELASARDVEVRRLADEQKDARERCSAGIADADAAYAALRDELDQELANEIKAKLYPLIARFQAEPRAVATELSDVWRGWRARAEEEIGATGADLAPRHISFAFLASMSEDALARGVTSRFVEHVRLTTSVTKLIEDGAGAAAVEGALRDLEIALSRALACDVEADPRRVAVAQRWATLNRLSIAFTAYDRDVAKERHEAAKPVEEARLRRWAAQQAANIKSALGIRGPQDRMKQFAEKGR